MSKRMLIFLLFCVLLSGCASRTSWEDEQLEEVSHRLLSDDVEAFWTVDQNPSSGKPHAARIRLELHKRDGTPVESFDLNHEKWLHLMIVGKDLSYFHHVHPEYKGKGLFEIDNAFPAGGDYRLIADFKPSGGDAMTKMEWVRLQGPAARPNPIVPDKTLVKTANGVSVKLNIDRLAADADSTLSFTFTDEASGRPVSDLQPYLGAIGHVVILSEDGERYVHVHAEEGQGSGPEAVFETSFPGGGIYKIWGQFQRNDRVMTVSYVVDVPQEAAGE
jgi:hypothetical protein